MRPMIDGHLDLAMNLVYYDRDITLPLAEMNRQESGLTDQKFRGRGTVSLPEMRRGGVGVCLATLLARSGPRHQRSAEYRRADLDFASPEGAYACARAQLGFYDLMEERGELRRLRTSDDLRDHWRRWSQDDNHDSTPIGIILSVEGADPIPGPESLEQWVRWGVRAIGLSHYGPGRYAAGTGTEGGLTDLGKEMLAAMRALGVALDVTHLADEAMEQAFELYEGPIWASHHNCRSLVDWDRQLSDEQIKNLIARDGVIGLAFDAIMLLPGWRRGISSCEELSIERAADHVDHIAQLAGTTRHCAIGTDLDGGYGWEQTPRELKSIVDVHRLEATFERRGYSAADIDGIFWGTWLRKRSETLP
ncbi:MAG: membrane dipeptidase [Pirellulaceae bacterium]